MQGNGVACPVLKPGTLDANVVSFFVFTSDYIRDKKVPWLPPSQALFQDQANPQRHNIFASLIHAANIIEYLCIGLTNLFLALSCHSDRERSPTLAMAAVIGFNITLRRGVLGVPLEGEGNTVQVGVTATGRQSIDHALRREGTDLPLAMHVADYYCTTLFQFINVAPLHSSFKGKGWNTFPEFR